jgi:hypothetical protein
MYYTGNNVMPAFRVSYDSLAESWTPDGIRLFLSGEHMLTTTLPEFLNTINDEENDNETKM